MLLRLLHVKEEKYMFLRLLIECRPQSCGKLRKLKIEECGMQVVKLMYNNGKLKFWVSKSYNELVNVTVGVNRGSVLNPLIIVMEVL